MSYQYPLHFKILPNKEFTHQTSEAEENFPRSRLSGAIHLTGSLVLLAIL